MEHSHRHEHRLYPKEGSACCTNAQCNAPRAKSLSYKRSWESISGYKEQSAMCNNEWTTKEIYIMNQTVLFGSAANAKLIASMDRIKQLTLPNHFYSPNVTASRVQSPYASRTHWLPQSFNESDKRTWLSPWHVQPHSLVRIAF